MSLSTPSAASLMIVLALAVTYDVRERRIPNYLTIGGMVLALALRGLDGYGSVAAGVVGAFVALTLLAPLVLLGGVGGGDAKLLSAVGAFLGPQTLFPALLATAVFGGLMAIAYSIHRGVVIPALLNTRGLFAYMLSGGRRGERTTLKTDGALSVPYGVAIAAGTLVALWYGTAA